MKNVLVTGGAGFIGSHTVVELVAAGYNPIIVDNFANSDESVIKRLEEITGQSIIFYQSDFQDKTVLSKILTKHSVDGVIHFAAHKAVNESIKKPLEYYKNNVAGLLTLLEAMKEVGVSSLIFSSSAVVYGDPDHLPLTESAALKPSSSPYGSTKQMDETIIADTVRAEDKLRAIALRYFNPIGAHPSGLIGELPLGTPANLVPYLIQAAAGVRDELIVFGNDYETIDGTGVRDYIHVLDVAKAHIKALEHLENQPAHFYDVFNIGTGSGKSVLELIKTFETVTGQKVPYKIGPRRDGDVASVYADATKANDTIHWQAELSIEDALRDAWNWQQNLAKSQSTS